MNPINLAVQQIKAALGYDVRYGAAGWQMKVGSQWITANAQASQTFDAILAQITASVVAGQLQNQAQGGGSGGGSGGGGRGGVRSRIRLSRHPGVSFGIPGVRLRLGARPGLILSPGSEEGPIGTAAVYGATIIGLVGSITAALATASRHAMQYSREVLTLSQQSGMGLRASQTAINTAGGFGIGAGEISSQNILFQRARAGIYGGSGTGDEADIRAFRQMYQRYASQGPLGLLSAQRIAESTGKTPYINAASMPRGMFEAQMRRTSQLGQAFGLSPHQLEMAGYATKNFFDTIGQAFSLFWTKVGGSVTEKLQPFLDKGLDWLAQRSGIAGTMIQKGVDASYKALITFARFLYVNLPGMIAGAGISILQLMKSISGGASALWDRLNSNPLLKLLRLTPGTPTTNGTPGPSGGPSMPGVAAGNGIIGNAIDYAKNNPLTAGALGLGAWALRNPLLRGAWGAAKGAAKFGWDALTGNFLANKNVVGATSNRIAARLPNPWLIGGALGLMGYNWLHNETVNQRHTPGMQFWLDHLFGSSLGDIGSGVVSGVGGLLGLGGGGSPAARAAAMMGGGTGSDGKWQPEGGWGTPHPGGVLQNAIDVLQNYQANLGSNDERGKYFDKQIALLERIAGATEKTAGQPPMTPEEWASALRSRGRYEAQDRLRASYNVG